MSGIKVGDFYNSDGEITQNDIQYFLDGMKNGVFLTTDTTEFEKSNITHKEDFRGPGFYEVLKLTLMSGAEVPVPTSDKEFTNNNTITWTWTKIDGAVKYLIKINEESKDPVTTEEYTISNLTDGLYKISVASENNAGIISNYGTHTVEVDTTAPGVPNPRTTSPTDTLTPTFTWSDYVGSTGETYKFGVRFGKAVTNFEDLTETVTTEKSFTPSANIEVGITYKIYVCSIDNAGNKSEYGQFDVIKNVDGPIINTEYEIANASADIEVSSNFNEIITHGYGFNGDYYTWNSATSSFEYKQEVPLDTSTTEQNVYITNNYGKVRRSILSARYFPMFIKDTLIYVEQSSNSSIGPSYYCTVGRYPGLGLYGTGTRCSSSRTLRYSQNGKTVEYSLYDLYYFQANVNYSGYRILKSNGDTLSKDDNWKTSFPTTTWNESSTFSPEHNVLICTEFVNTYDQQYNATASKSGVKVYPYIPSSLTNEYKKTDVHYNASNFYWRECNGNYTSAGGNPGSVRIRNHSSSFTQNPFNNAYGLCFYHLEDGKWVKKKNVTYNPEAASQDAFPKFLQKYSSFTKDNTIHINAISSDKKSLISAKYIPTTQTYLVVGKTTIDTDLYGKYDSDHVFALSESIILVVVQDKEYKSKIMKIYQVDGSTDSHTELWSFTYTDKNIEDINISEDRTNVCILSKDAEDKYEIGIFTTSGDKQKLNYLENANLQETTRIRINSLHISNNFNSTNDGKSYTNVKRVIYSQSGIKFIDFHNENEIDTSPPSIDINDADTPTNDKEISWSFAVEGHSGDVTGKIKSKPSSSSVSVVTISGNTAIITADVEGEYSIELIALNEAGNAVTKTSNSVTYDKTPTNEPNPSTTTPTNNLKPTWSWSGVADAEKYKVTLSSDSDTTHEITNTEFTPSSNLTEGGHTISVIAVDEAGNESEAGTHTVVIDATAPSVPNPVSDTEFTNNNTITWTWNKIDGAVKYLIKINEESKDPITTEEYTISELEEGIYKISVASEDNAGNTTNYGTHTVKFDLCGEFYYDIKMNWESLHEKRSLYSPSRNSVDFKEEEPPNDYFGTPSWIKLQSSPDPQDNTGYNHWVTALIPRKYKLTTDVEELTLQYSSIYTVSPAKETTPFLVVKQNDTLFFQSTSSSVGETIKITKDNFLGTFFGDQPNLNFTQDSQFEFGFGFVQGYGYNLNTHVNISKFEMCWSDGGKLIDVTDVPSPTTVTSE